MIKFSFSFLLAVILMAATPASAQEKYIVTPNNLNGWAAYEQATATYGHVNGPATPPLGTGSVMLTTGAGDPTKSPGGGKAFFFNNSYNGMLLANLTMLEYSTYTTTSTTLTTAINIAVDFVGDGSSFTTIVFEPVYYYFGVGGNPVLANTWQRWNPMYGKWWSTRNIPGVCAFSCYVNFQDIVAANPNAKIRASSPGNVGGIQFVVGQNSVGAPWAYQINYIDYITIGIGGDDTVGDDIPGDQLVTEYDLELNSYPQTADDCKNGGYKTFNPAFRNQGQCVASMVGVTP